MFLRVHLKKKSIGLDNGLALNKQQAIIWTNADLIHWRIYAALGGDELKEFATVCHIELIHSPFPASQ